MRGAEGAGGRASFGLLVRRVAAYAIDAALLLVVLAPAGFAVRRLLGVEPASTGPGVWRTILWNFSLPVWIYFTASDLSASGATFGKRRLRIRVRSAGGRRLGPARALLRTAVKLLPWEAVHVAAFALSADLAVLGRRQVVGLVAADALVLAYLAVAAATRGRRSVHDVAAGTVVERAGQRRSPRF